MRLGKLPVHFRESWEPNKVQQLECALARFRSGEMACVAAKPFPAGLGIVVLRINSNNELEEHYSIVWDNENHLLNHFSKEFTDLEWSYTHKCTVCGRRARYTAQGYWDLFQGNVEFGDNRKQPCGHRWQDCRDVRDPQSPVYNG